MYKHIFIAILTLFLVAATTLGSFWIVSKPVDNKLNLGFPFQFLSQDYSKYGNGDNESEKFPTTWNFDPSLDQNRFPTSFNASNFWANYIIYLLLIELLVEIGTILFKKIN